MSGTSSCHLGVNILRLDNTLLVVCMHDGFLCYHKTGTHLHCLGTQHHSCCHTSSVCNSSGCNNRNVHCIHHLRYQSHSGCGANMSTRLSSLCDNCISTRTDHHLCHGHTGNYRNYLYSGFFPLRDKLTRISCSGSHYRNLLLDYHLCHFRSIGIHQHYIHTERLVCQLFHPANLLTNHLCRRTGCADDSQTACLRYSRCQVVLSHPGHSALYHRILNP